MSPVLSDISIFILSKAIIGKVIISIAIVSFVNYKKESILRLDPRTVCTTLYFLCKL